MWAFSRPIKFSLLGKNGLNRANCEVKTFKAHIVLDSFNEMKTIMAALVHLMDKHALRKKPKKTVVGEPEFRGL